MDVWEVRHNGQNYGRHTGPSAEQQARQNFAGRLVRPKGTYDFQLVKNGVVVETRTSGPAKKDEQK